jgi:asparaginyl-tRNA synthetase
MFRVTTLSPGLSDSEQDFFGKEANLTVSGQLEAEMAALALGDVYTFGPTFSGGKFQYATPRRRILDD